MFQASICPSSGVLGCVCIILLHMVFSTRCCGWGSEEPVCSLVHWCKFVCQSDTKLIHISTVTTFSSDVCCCSFHQAVSRSRLPSKVPCSRRSFFCPPCLPFWITVSSAFQLADFSFNDQTFAPQGYPYRCFIHSAAYSSAARLTCKFIYLKVFFLQEYPLSLSLGIL